MLRGAEEAEFEGRKKIWGNEASMMRSVTRLELEAYAHGYERIMDAGKYSTELAAVQWS
jgi:hypothetical protein